MVVIDSKSIINKYAKTVPDYWHGSKHENWYNIINQQKGKAGTDLYSSFLESRGYETREISDEGDLLYRKRGQQKWNRVEVKAGKANLKFLKDGFVTEQFWFNQIRPKQGGWDEVALVCVYPNHIKILINNRESFDSLLREHQGGVKNSLDGLSHKGTEELAAVVLKKNTKINNFNEWREVYCDQNNGEY